MNIMGRYNPLAPDYDYKYRTVENPIVSYSSQASTLTNPKQITLPGSFVVLDSVSLSQAAPPSCSDIEALANAESKKFSPPLPPSSMPHDGVQKLSGWQINPFCDEIMVEPSFPVQIASEDVELIDMRVPTVGRVPTRLVSLESDDQLASEWLYAGETPAVPSANSGRSHIVGDNQSIQCFATAVQTNHMFESILNEDIDYILNDENRVSIKNGESSTYYTGPTSSGARINTAGRMATSDPDVIAHEFGHAILSNFRDLDANDSYSNSAHEAFADSTAMLAALRHIDVRADVLNRRYAGTNSNMACVLAEGYRASIASNGEDPDPFANPREGLRDFSLPGPQCFENPNEEPHDAGRRFTHGLYCSLLSIEQDIRAQDPSIGEMAALEKACDIVTHDFVLATKYLPNGTTLTQSELATAVIEADKQHNNGQYAQIYNDCFTQAYLTPTDSSLIGPEMTKVYARQLGIGVP